MSESAMEKLKTSVSETITETYTSAVFDSMGELQTGMVEAADGSQQLTDGASQLEAGSQTLSSWPRQQVRHRHSQRSSVPWRCSA